MSAAATAANAQIFNNNNPDVNRHEIQAAISKAVELRALHAALMQGNNSPANIRYPISASPSLSRPSSHFSAQDYPVFTPSYEVEPLPGYHQNQFDDDWDGFGLVPGDKDEAHLSYCVNDVSSSSSSRKVLPTSFTIRESPASCSNHITVLQTSPREDMFKSSRRIASVDFKSITTCNKCSEGASSVCLSV